MFGDHVNATGLKITAVVTRRLRSEPDAVLTSTEASFDEPEADIPLLVLILEEMTDVGPRSNSRFNIATPPVQALHGLRPKRK